MERTDWVGSADPSWHVKVLTRLQEKYPAIADELWNDVITANATRSVEENL